jgi:hypothetical protein
MMNTNQLVSTLEMVKRMVTASGIANNEMCNINELLDMVISDLKPDESAAPGASVAFSASSIRTHLTAIQEGLDKIEMPFNGSTKSSANKSLTELTEYIWLCYHGRNNRR